jgi:hypothetical protein
VAECPGFVDHALSIESFATAGTTLAERPATPSQAASPNRWGNVMSRVLPTATS